uniref:Uncharacterized protein n=1 Tax=Timema tahoe TaxID=61484 RepID=A0A7R9NYG5_9NEOP|nr:unnamed protein product [Timema tahoe]
MNLLMVCLLVTLAQAIDVQPSPAVGVCECPRIHCNTCDEAQNLCCKSCCPEWCRCDVFDCKLCAGSDPCCQKCCEQQPDEPCCEEASDKEKSCCHDDPGGQCCYKAKKILGCCYSNSNTSLCCHQETNTNQDDGGDISNEAGATVETVETIVLTGDGSDSNVVIHNYEGPKDSHYTSHVVQDIVLPNITIFINQSPIVIENNPTIAVKQMCGNVTVQAGGYPGVRVGEGCGSSGTWDARSVPSWDSGTIPSWDNDTIPSWDNGTIPSRGNGTDLPWYCCRVHRPGHCVPVKTKPFIKCEDPKSAVVCGQQCFRPYGPRPLRLCLPLWPYGQCQTPCLGQCRFGMFQPQCRPSSFWPHVICRTPRAFGVPAFRIFPNDNGIPIF